MAVFIHYSLLGTAYCTVFKLLTSVVYFLCSHLPPACSSSSIGHGQCLNGWSCQFQQHNYFLIWMSDYSEFTMHHSYVYISDQSQFDCCILIWTYWCYLSFSLTLMEAAGSLKCYQSSMVQYPEDTTVNYSTLLSPYYLTV